VVGVVELGQRGEDRLAPGVGPPAADDRLAGDRLGDARHRAARRGEHDAVLLDEREPAARARAPSRPGRAPRDPPAPAPRRRAPPPPPAAPPAPPSRGRSPYDWPACPRHAPWPASRPRACRPAARSTQSAAFA